MEEILALYRQEYNPKRPMVCFDEASYQLLGHTRDPILVQQGIPTNALLPVGIVRILRC